MDYKYIHDVEYVENIIDLFLEFVSKQPEQHGLKPSFSNGYGGLLRHNRAESDRKKLNLGSDITVKSLNIIKYPTSKYESMIICLRSNSTVRRAQELRK